VSVFHAAMLDVNIALGTCKCLGLSSMIGRSKTSMFKIIKDRVWKKMNSWSGKTLSRAGREVRIKLVLQVIPTYMMSIFLIPSFLGNRHSNDDEFILVGSTKKEIMAYIGSHVVNYRWTNEYGGIGFQDLY